MTELNKKSIYLFIDTKIYVNSEFNCQRNNAIIDVYCILDIRVFLFCGKTFRSIFPLIVLLYRGLIYGILWDKN